MVGHAATRCFGKLSMVGGNRQLAKKVVSASASGERQLGWAGAEGVGLYGGADFVLLQ